MATPYDNSDFSVIKKAGMNLGHSAQGLQLPGLDPKIRHEAIRLCARDYLEHHVFFNFQGFQNHLIHHLLATLTLGANASRLQDIYDKNKPMQRDILPAVEGVSITKDNYGQYLSNEKYYSEFLKFFRSEIEARDNDWKSVVREYLFDSRVYPLAFSGIFHPIIQIGYGAEFDSPAIVAMGLAQACVRKPSFTELLGSPQAFGPSSTISADGDGLSIMAILEKVKQDRRRAVLVYDPDAINSPEQTRTSEEIAIEYAKHWTVDAHSLDDKYYELLSITALIYGAITRPGFESRYEFGIMHCLTSLYFLPVLFDALTPVERVSVLRSQFAAILWFFLMKGCPAFYLTPEVASEDTHSAIHAGGKADEGNPWFAVFEKAIKSDDIHVVKAVRSLWRGSILSSFRDTDAKGSDDYELPPPVNWLGMAKGTVDTITTSDFEDRDEQIKAGKREWTHGQVGLDQYWEESWP